MILINHLITKKFLTKVLKTFFKNFNFGKIYYLFESLKLLGFYFAKLSGISLGFKDFKRAKTQTIFFSHIINNEKNLSNLTQSSLRTYLKWNYITENFKRYLFSYYKKFKKINNLFSMLFSGARGNLEQINHLIGFGGLILNPAGNLQSNIIMSNFSQGLSNTDYISSTYGARKGIMDTTIQTAKMGTLTRHLLHFLQNIYLQEINCYTKDCIIYKIFKSINKTKLRIFNHNNLKNFQNSSYYTQTNIKTRSALTCLNKTVCQLCYFQNKNVKKFMNLGSYLGIITTNSIIEPTMQLTMQTFHTGGITKNSNLSSIKSPVSGYLKVILLNNRTLYFNSVDALNIFKKNIIKFLHIIHWNGNLYILKIKKFFKVCIFDTNIYIKKFQLLASYDQNLKIYNQQKYYPLLTTRMGELYSFTTLIKNITSKEINNEKTQIILHFGYYSLLPKEIKLESKSLFNAKTAFGELKITLPSSFIHTFATFSTSDLLKFLFNSFNTLLNINIKVVCFLKKYQKLESEAILYKVYFHPKISILTLKTRLKSFFFYNSILFLTKYDTYNIYSEKMVIYSSMLNSLSLIPYFVSNIGLTFKHSKYTSILLDSKAIVLKKRHSFCNTHDLLTFKQYNIPNMGDVIQILNTIQDLFRFKFFSLTNNLTILQFGFNLLNKNYIKQNSLYRYSNFIVINYFCGTKLRAQKFVFTLNNPDIFFKTATLQTSIYTAKHFFKFGSFINMEKSNNLLKLRDNLFVYYSIFYNFSSTFNYTLRKLQIIYLNTLKSFYRFNSIKIKNTHFEVLLKKMCSIVFVQHIGDTPLLLNELLLVKLVQTINRTLYLFKYLYKLVIYKPTFFNFNYIKYKLSFGNTIAKPLYQTMLNLMFFNAIDWLEEPQGALLLNQQTKIKTNHFYYLNKIFYFKK